MLMKRKIVFFVLIVIFAVNLGIAGTNEVDIDIGDDFNSIQLDSAEYKFEKDWVYIYRIDDDNMYIKITSDKELFINGERINIGFWDKRLLHKYYKNLRKVKRMSQELAQKGSELGLKGGEMALEAILKMPLILLDGTDEYEQEIEAEADKIEKEADKLEKRGEEIEEIADKVGKYKKKLKAKIEALDALEWY